MKKKTQKSVAFIDDLHHFIISNPQFRKDTSKKSEQFVQAEIRPLIIQYLENHFNDQKYVDYVGRAQDK